MRKPLAVLLCALMLLSATASAQRVLSMATLAPAGSTWMRVFDAANRELRRRTNGQLSMRWYPGGVQGDEGEVVRKIRNGRLDGAAITAVGLGQVHRPMLAFQIPGIFDSPTNLVRARDALRPEILSAFDTAGFTLLGFGSAGAPRMISRLEIRTPAQLRTSHPWQWSDDMILPQVFAEAGVTGVRLQVPEVLGAIQTNRVDTVFASPLAATALQWTSQMQFMSDRPNGASLGALIMSRTQFNSLPADQQAIMREVQAQFDTLLARNVARDDDAAAAALRTRGIREIVLTPAERAEWTALFTRTRPRYTGVIADAAWITRVEAAGRGAVAPAAHP